MNKEKIIEESIYKINKYNGDKELYNSKGYYNKYTKTNL